LYSAQSGKKNANEEIEKEGEKRLGSETDSADA
jgi:hypothetical protein